MSKWRLHFLRKIKKVETSNIRVWHSAGLRYLIKVICTSPVRLFVYVNFFFIFPIDAFYIIVSIFLKILVAYEISFWDIWIFSMLFKELFWVISREIPNIYKIQLYIYLHNCVININTILLMEHSKILSIAHHKPFSLKTQFQHIYYLYQIEYILFAIHICAQIGLYGKRSSRPPSYRTKKIKKVPNVRKKWMDKWCHSFLKNK